MAPSIDLLLFTIGPLAVMAAALIYTLRGIYHLSDVRPFLLVALLGLMMLHQMTELAEFSGLGFLPFRSRPAEAFESGANVLASVASYFIVQHLRELRTTEVELKASNAALRERSTMVNVLHRILRHNVRNDVNILVGYAANAAERIDDEVALAQLQTIQKRARGLATISNRTQRIRQLLSEDPTATTTFRLPEDLQEPIETVLVDAPSATISLDGPQDVGLTARVPTTFALTITDVLEQIIVHNDGDVAVEVTVSGERSRSDDGGSIEIRIDDDGDGLPNLDIQTIEQGDETPLMHAQDVALWCLSWVVDRADGILDLRPEEGTLKIQLPQSASGVAD